MRGISPLAMLLSAGTRCGPTRPCPLAILPNSKERERESVEPVLKRWSEREATGQAFREMRGNMEEGETVEKPFRERGWEEAGAPRHTTREVCGTVARRRKQQ
jgi:hypothetical protein